MSTKKQHEIFAENVGIVYNGEVRKAAQECFGAYKKMARRGTSRVGKEVVWFIDGEIYQEYRVKEKPKPVHNEYFRTVSLSNRKSCPNCQAKLQPGESLWSWGEYVRVQWRTVMHFCKECFQSEVIPRLQRHKDDCGCEFNLNVMTSFHEKRPEWLTMPQKEKTCSMIGQLKMTD